ncbi:MAG TPA: glycosyltransferase family 39 protein [Gaiellaceae bacterium]|nr:glycosyltransferase family 39 protein [Gaiellaceae bacterium]
MAALPRLIVLLYERGHILAAFVDKSDIFARTYVSSGTFGFLPHHPSAYTQPLYGFFLVPLYWIFGRHWEVVGVAQIAVAVGTALLVYEIGRRVVSSAAGVVAAAAATIHPYLVWHDVHLNREILDQFVAAAVVLLALVASARPTLRVFALLGIAFGLAILGNVRLAALPLVIALFVLWQAGWHRPAVVGVVFSLVVGAVVVAPWVVRNRVSVGCFAVTTDARALWKANNVNTYRTLTHGGWIDDVPSYRGAPPTPQDAYERYLATGRYTPVNECAQMRFFSHKVHAFWLHHPAEKEKLALLAGQMEWQPSVVETSGRSEKGTFVDSLRTSSEPLFVVPLYLLAAAGLFFVPRAFAVLAVLLAAYQTAVAMIFVGVTRYRVPWDFLLCVLASAALVEVVRRVRELRRERVVGRPHLEQ